MDSTSDKNKKTGITAGEFSSLGLTANEFDSLQITAKQFDDMSYDKLLSLAEEKLERFKKLPEKTPISKEMNIIINNYYNEFKISVPDTEKPKNNQWSKVALDAFLNTLLGIGTKAALEGLFSLLQKWYDSH